VSRLTTDLPQRLDRLPWSRWHWTVVGGLGITWILDGLEVTIVGAVGPRLQEHATLALSSQEIGTAASAYLGGAVAGAILFGDLTDRFGRKRLFLITLTWYLVFTLATAASWDVWSFALFRTLTGMGIGGEYAAINSAIDELIPSARRGWADLAINGSWWFGTLIGSLASLVLLDPHLIPANLGWRLCFLLGAVLAITVIFVRRTLPESPRWLLLRGRTREASDIVAQIEHAVERSLHAPLPPACGTIALDAERVRTGYIAALITMLRRYPQRSVVALCLMVAQAFIYNAIFFTEALVLSTFFNVPSSRVGLYIIPFAIGNLLGPILLGHFFDTIGRKRMIAGTYGISAILLIATGWLFAAGALDATTITIAWSIVFFFASAGASAAYLTVSETFPLESRAMAIAIVYSIGTLVGGAVAPALFGALIATASRTSVFAGYLVGAAAMLVAAIVELILGVEAARKLLEDVTPPLAASKEA
jgi:MFS family permease